MTDKAFNAGVVMDVRVGQSLMIGNTRVTVERKTGQIARLRVAAEESIVIRRYHGDDLKKIPPANSTPTGGEDAALPVVAKTDLESGAGDEVTMTLIAKLRGKPIEGDEKGQGREMKLSHYTHKMRIDKHGADFHQFSNKSNT